MNSILKRFSKLNLILAAILLLGLGLRLWGINFGLPYMYDPDEGATINVVLKMLHTGNLNPSYFDWPSFSFYLYLVVYWFLSVLGRGTGRFGELAGLPFPDQIIMAVGKTSVPEEFLVGRGLTIILGVLSILIVYRICFELTGNRAPALFAALLMATEPISVEYSRIIRPDTFVVFFVLVSFLFAQRIIENPSFRNYILAAVAAGLGTSSKYNAALIVIPLVVAHLLMFRGRSFFRKEIYLSAFVTVASFLLTSPFVVLDFTRFFQIGPLEVAGHYASGHPGAEGDSFQWYVSLLFSNLGWVLWLALAGAMWILLKRDRKGIALLSFPLSYLAFISLYNVHFPETILPAIPFVIILASAFLHLFYDSVLRMLAVRQRWPTAALWGLSLLLLAPPLANSSVTNDIRLTRVDGREQARQWIEANLSKGSRFAVESYSPYIDRREFVVSGFYGLQDNSPDWYVSNGYEYLVFSQGIFGRYFADPVRYSSEVNRYNAFFARFSQVARFDDNGYEVRIYKTGTVLPSHRVAARFGNYGEVIELVGYDVASSKWMPGEPLSVKLYWRTLADKSEPLQVALRLIDKSDREISSARGDLFQGKGWQEGIFETDWTIPTNTDAAPGAYHLNVSVIQTQYSYSLPAKTWAGDNIDQVALGPFKMSVLPPTASELQAARQADIRFGDEIALLGYAGISDARAGDSLLLTLYWQALAKPTRDYTVFVHLLDADGKLVAQVDTQPREGTYPTSLWDAGEIIRDDYALKLPADLTPGVYHWEIGLYEYPSMARLPVVDSSGKVGDYWIMTEPVHVSR